MDMNKVYKAISFFFIGMIMIGIGIATAVVVNIDGSNLTPLSWFNSNKTVWDAKGNASYPVNVSNATGVLPNVSIPASAANKSEANTFGDVITISSNSEPAFVSRQTGMSGSPELFMDMNAGNNAALFQVSNATLGQAFKFVLVNGAQYLLTMDSTQFTATKPVFFTGLGAATSGTTLVLTGTNEIRPLSSSNKTKHDIKNVELPEVKNTLCDITKLDVNQFKWDGNNATDYGLIADDAAKICPEIVNFATGNTTVGGVNYSKGDAISINWATLTSLELEKIKEQNVRLQKLEDRGILDVLFAKQIDYLYKTFNLTKT